MTTSKRKSAWRHNTGRSTIEMTPSERAADEALRKAAVAAFKARGGRIKRLRDEPARGAVPLKPGDTVGDMVERIMDARERRPALRTPEREP